MGEGMLDPEVRMIRNMKRIRFQLAQRKEVSINNYEPSEY